MAKRAAAQQGSRGSIDDDDVEDYALSAEDIDRIMQNTKFQSLLGNTIKDTLDQQLQTSLNNILPNCMAPFFAEQTKTLFAGLDAKIDNAVSPINQTLKHLDARLTGLEANDSAMSGEDSAGLQRVMERLDKQDKEIERIATTPSRSPTGSVDGASTPGGAWGMGPSPAVLAPFPGGTFATPPRGLGSAASFSPMAGSPSSTDFDRCTDPGILKISATKPFARTEASRLAQKIVREADIPATVGFDVEGISPGTSFVIRFKEAPDQAARHTNKVLQAQKTGPAQWKRYEASCPGDTPEAPCTNEMLFINCDKNGRQVKREVAARKLVAILKAAHSDKRFVCLSKTEGIVGLAEGKPWKALAQVSVLSAANVEIYWNQDIAGKIGVNTATATASFNEEIGFASGVQWTKG